MCITALSESLNAQTIGGIWLLSHSANCECKVFCLGTLPTPASARSFKVEKQRSNIPHSELWPFLAILDNFHKSFGLHCESGTLSLKMRSATDVSKSVPLVRDMLAKTCLNQKGGCVFYSSTRQRPISFFDATATLQEKKMEIL